MKEFLAFDDVLLEPQFSSIKSRRDVSTSQFLAGLNLDIPIISSNMDSVTTENMAHAMQEVGAAACLHRFQSIENNVHMYRNSPATTMVSVGLGKVELDRAVALREAGAHIFVIDVAHGASSEVVMQTKMLREQLGDINLIVGNFATARTIKDFIYHLGSTYKKDLTFKVGVGQGSACTTRVVTGCGVPALGSILDCAMEGVPIICDGGIRNSGDFAKALAAGASAVMLGGLLAGSDESPAEHVNLNQANFQTLVKHKNKNLPMSGEWKSYRGSASHESYEAQGKVAGWRTSEGEAFLVPYSGPVAHTIQKLEAGLRSAMSYTGSSNLKEFRENVEFVRVTHDGVRENGAHGKGFNN